MTAVLRSVRERLDDWSREKRVVLYGMVAVTAATVGYEAGSVLAGEPFTLLAVLPALLLLVVVALVLDDSVDI